MNYESAKYSCATIFISVIGIPNGENYNCIFENTNQKKKRKIINRFSYTSITVDIPSFFCDLNHCYVLHYTQRDEVTPANYNCVA